jgi:ankyrin repeat protein
MKIVLANKGASMNGKIVSMAVFWGGLCVVSKQAQLAVVQASNAQTTASLYNAKTQSLLELVAAGDLEEVAAALSEGQVDSNAQDSSGCTPLHVAAFYGYPEIAQLLLHHGANVQAKTTKELRYGGLVIPVGATALDIARLCKCGSVQSILESAISKQEEDASLEKEIVLKRLLADQETPSRELEALLKEVAAQRNP